ncbi:UBP1-associated protein 2B-like [Iris pallida]|uniref:UBP1-associated protein 2B-like n=1 Tax=Iris pallida TaxID=29817 RepID=A0AAX6GPR5_IRIPA|nr:UBP1-associated protein 2B-like [Iris pallida]
MSSSSVSAWTTPTTPYNPSLPSTTRSRTSTSSQTRPRAAPRATPLSPSGPARRGEGPQRPQQDYQQPDNHLRAGRLRPLSRLCYGRPVQTQSLGTGSTGVASIAGDHSATPSTGPFCERRHASTELRLIGLV